MKRTRQKRQPILKIVIGLCDCLKKAQLLTVSVQVVSECNILHRSVKSEGPLSISVIRLSPFLGGDGKISFSAFSSSMMMHSFKGRPLIKLELPRINTSKQHYERTHAKIVLVHT